MARRRTRKLILSERAARIYGIVGVIFILISGILAGIAVYNFSYAQRVISEGESISAVCTKTWSETKTTTTKKSGKTKKKTKHTYYYADATYLYKDQYYDCHRLSADSNTKVGDYIRVYVLPENPGKYVQPEQKSDWFPMIIAFGFTALMGISMVSTAISNLRRFRKYGYIDNTTYQTDNSMNTCRNYHNSMGNQYDFGNTYQNYDNQYNNNYQGYNPNNSYQGYDNHNQW